MSRTGSLLSLLLISTAWSIPAAAQTPAEGVKVYNAQKCQICHMIEGKGNKNGRLDGVGAKLTAEEIRNWIVKPTEMAEKAKATRKPPMKAYMLSEADLNDLVAYLQSLKGAQ